MAPEVVLDLFGQALWLIILIVSILVVPSLLVGLMIATFQAATQINEQTLSFLPRLLTTLTALMFAGPWLLTRLMDFTHQLVENLSILIS